MSTIFKVTEYDLLSINRTDGNYYMCVDSRKLYKDTESTRLIVPAIIVNTEMDRQYNIKPSVGSYYYIWETNELWLFNGGWVVIVGSAKKYNGFYYNQGNISGVDETTVVDNNGLLKDGSVVVRDINRVIKGRVFINQDITDATDTNNLVIASMLGGGVTILPNGVMNGSGMLKLLSAGTYVGPTGEAEVLENGKLIFNGDIYTTDSEGNETKITSNEETAKEWQEGKLDKIHSRVSFNPIGEGWYRVAEFGGSEYTIKGTEANSCEIHIKRKYKVNNNETYRIQLDSVYNAQEFKLISAKSRAQYITKIRYTYDETNVKAYIELYYDSVSTEDAISVELLSVMGSAKNYWNTIATPTLTEETVDGVTVTTTYDISANATPATDLDIGYLENFKKWDDSWTSVTNAPLGIYNITSTQFSSITDLPSKMIRQSWLIKLKRTNENFYLFHTPAANSDKGTTWIGNQYGSKVTWDMIIKESDLANYFKNTGGTINGNISQWIETETVVTHKMRNPKRNIEHLLQADGKYRLFDYTNSKSIIDSALDGTNIFYGIANGNLSLTGGVVDGTVGVNALTLPQRNLSGKVAIGTNGTHLQIYENGGDMRGVHLDFAECARGVNSKILHTGNSNVVKISNTAPSDTTALWYDTVNKLMKRCVDGAWQQ